MRYSRVGGALLCALWLPLIAAGAAEQKAIRIISTDQSTTALIVALGAAPELVGIDTSSEVPADQDGVAQIGYHRALSAEGLLSLSPTLLAGNENMGPPETLAVLKKAGVDVLSLPSAMSTAELQDNILRLGDQLDRQEQAAALSNAVSEQVDTVRRGLSTAGMRAAFFLSVNGNSLRMAGTGTGGDALIRLLGADNVAEYANYRSLSIESVLGLQPDLILVTGEDAQALADQFLAENVLLVRTSAGAGGRVFGVDSGAIIAGLSIKAIEEANRISDLVAALPAGSDPPR